ncbi:D-alanine--D-alanine ligase [candidate division KSB1 bacterium]|nr:D-alanine--D-alanine ligase [candidate division KSB1 bacterium]
MSKLRVGILFGGRSCEHEVSLQSARSVVEALDKDKYEVLLIGISKEGKWLVSSRALEYLKEGKLDGGGQPMVMLNYPASKSLVKIQDETIAPSRAGEKVDVVFPLLHGPFGEDGTVQGLLELADVPYVGAGVMASAVGMDKGIMKMVFKAHNLPILDFMVLKRGDWEGGRDKILVDIGKEFDYPLFIKPCNLGSSVGISKVHNFSELAPALNLAAQYDRKMIIEQGGINCREIEASVLGNDDPIVSVPGEIIPCNEFYDYDAKYIDENSQLIIPADLPIKTIEEIQQIAVKAFKAVDCAGMARVDFLVQRETHEIYLSEVNTIPGFTKISMYPKLWEASGISYTELISRLIELAIERHRDKKKSITSYR